MTEPAETRQFLLDLFEAAVAAGDPAACVPPSLPAPPKGRTVVVGAGKAAAAMAQAVEAHWPEDAPLSGLVVTRYGHGLPCRRIEVVEAGHPVPDAQGAQAAQAILHLVSGLGPDDLVLALISGGGSALLALPAPGVTLAEKQAITRALLHSGAAIGEINCVRKHLSAIKGGRLALAAYPARLVTLAISDVPGDDPGTIASGPTVGDPSTIDEARDVLARYHIPVSPALNQALAETPKPDDPRLAAAEIRVIASSARALAAAERLARERGWAVENLGDAVEGEARAVAAAQATRAKAVHGSRVLISGGETTVTVTGGGKGGRNAEFALALALALDGAPGISALACDTDGIDGSEDNAGAVVLPDTLARARALGEDARTRLAANDSYGFFAALSDLVVTGPTRTNVNDFRAIIIAR